MASGLPAYAPEAALPTAAQISTTVIQQLLEDVTGTPFRELMQELVLQRLGMSDSDYAQPLRQSLQENAATGHNDLWVPLEGRWDVYPQLAAAGLGTTPTDLSRFAIGVERAYAGAEGGTAFA